MAFAVDLRQAAGQAFDNLFALWVLGENRLKNALAAFSTDVGPIFPDSEPVGRPLGNWTIFMASLAATMPSFGITIPPSKIPYEQLVLATDYVYRICWLGAGPTSESPQITLAQENALLAAYNARF
jgi:hypothetical protein